MNELLAGLREWLLPRLSPGSASRGDLETTIEHDWPWPPWLTLLVLIAASLYVAWIYSREQRGARWRRASLAGLRMAAVGVLIFMLYGWTRQPHRVEPPEIVVAVDVSASMSVADAYQDARVRNALQTILGKPLEEPPARLRIATSLLSSDEWQTQLGQRYRVKLFRLGEGTQRLDASSDQWLTSLANLEAVEPQSRLGQGVRDLLAAQRGQSTAAIILLTDGVNTAGPTLGDAAVDARGNGIPLYIVGVGSDAPPRDVRVGNLIVDEFGFVGDVMTFDLQVHSQGLAGRKAVVQLLRKDDRRVLQEVAVQLPQDGVALPVHLAYRPSEEGEFEHEIHVTEFPEELDHGNNQVTCRLNIRDATIRVLLVQAAPSYEYRYLQSLLARATQAGDAAGRAVELTSVLQEADPERDDLSGTLTTRFPLSREELFQYDVLILGDVNPSFLSASSLENVAAFVTERGGGLVLIAGPRFMPRAFADTPLAALLPCDAVSVFTPREDDLVAEQFSVRAAATGETLPMLQLGDAPSESREVWSELPPLRWLLEMRDLKPGALVLLERATPAATNPPRAPVLLMQFVGAGKVVFQATDETYLWSRSPRGEVAYARYWLQILRYLGRAKLATDQQPVELMTDAQQYVVGDEVAVRAHFHDDRQAPALDDGTIVAVEDQRGRRVTLALQRDAANRGLFTGGWQDLAAGAYRLYLVAPALTQPPTPRQFTVQPPLSEMSHVEMNSTELKQAAQVTGGRFYTVSNASRLPRDLPRGEAVRVESLPPEPVWNSHWLAALVVALLTAEWLLRRKTGLL